VVVLELWHRQLLRGWLTWRRPTLLECGLLVPGADPGEMVVDNDSTLERYASIAVAQARAGSAVIAPSGMMDGQVLAIREEKKVDMRMAAYLLAVNRVAVATADRGIYP